MYPVKVKANLRRLVLVKFRLAEVRRCLDLSDPRLDSHELIAIASTLDLEERIINDDIVDLSLDRGLEFVFFLSGLLDKPCLALSLSSREIFTIISFNMEILLSIICFRFLFQVHNIFIFS